MPLRVMLPENTRITFWPILAMALSICALAPLPIPTLAITSPTPIIIPSIVSSVRNLLRSNARNASLFVAHRRVIWLIALLDGLRAGDVAHGLPTNDPAPEYH